MKEIIIIGTSHISPQSIKQAKETIIKQKPDCVAIELCPQRYRALIQNKRQSPTFLNPLYMILYYLQNFLGKKTGILPGSEMLASINAARLVNSRIVLIDMDISTIVQKINQISFIEKIKLIAKLILGFLIGFLPFGQKLDISKVPHEKLINEAMKYIKEEIPHFYKILVIQRNIYMANFIKKLSKKYDKIVVVVGAGHKKGIEKILKRNKLKTIVI